MQAEQALLAVSSSIAEGDSPDWAELAGDLDSAADRALLEELRVIASIAELHRDAALGPDRVVRPPAASSEWRVAADLPRQWGRFTLRERVGSGSFGEVYRAWDPQLQRDVAVKIWRQTLLVHDPSGGRMLREGRHLARVRHPHVVTVYGVEEHRGQVGLVMEFVRGRTFDEVLAAQGPLSAEEAVAVGQPLCAALAAVHGAGVVHRDVKARNVMREDGGRAVLMDFGAGQRIDDAAGRGRMAGTPYYLAPEVLAGGEASARSDIYSVGVLLFHLVSGEYPVTSDSIEGLQAAHAVGERRALGDLRPTLPPGFVSLVDRALSPDPADRPASAGQLARALASCVPVGGEAAVEARAASSGSMPGLSRRGFRLVSAVVAAGVVGALWWLTAGRTAVVTTAIQSIAVLPFVSASRSADEAYLARAVPSELSEVLASGGGMKVVPWAVSQHFPPPDPHGAAAPTDALVLGTVESVPPGPGEGDSRRLRVQVQVLQAGTNQLIWSRTYIRRLEEFLTLQAEIARAIAAGLEVTLARRAEERRATPTTRSQDAMELYLRGRELFDSSTLDGMQRAAMAFARAVEVDPQFARAQAALAESYVLLRSYYGAIGHDEALSKAMAASNRAVELDPLLAEAWALRGYARFSLSYRWEGVESDFKRALELNPGSAKVHERYSTYLAGAGRFEEAIAEARLAADLAPRSPAYVRAIAWAEYLGRDFEGVVRDARAALALDPDYVSARTLLARGFVLGGRPADGVAELERLVAGSPEYADMLAFAYARAGRDGDARAILDRLVGSGEGPPIVPFQIAADYGELGALDEAFGWLERAVREQDSNLKHLRVDPQVDSLRSDPRFDRLVARLGLTQ